MSAASMLKAPDWADVVTQQRAGFVVVSAYYEPNGRQHMAAHGKNVGEACAALLAAVAPPAVDENAPAPQEFAHATYSRSYFLTGRADPAGVLGALEVDESAAVVDATPAVVDATPAVVDATPAVVDATPAGVDVTPAGVGVAGDKFGEDFDYAPGDVVDGPQRQAVAFDPGAWRSLGEAQAALTAQIHLRHALRTASRQRHLERVLELTKSEEPLTPSQQTELTQHRQWSEELADVDVLRDVLLERVAGLVNLDEARALAGELD